MSLPVASGRGLPVAFGARLPVASGAGLLRASGPGFSQVSGPGFPRKILVLGGTTEGRQLAEACVHLPGISAVISLAGRTANPVPLPGRVRIGGFGGVPGLIGFLKEERIAAVIDATHPFAAGMTTHAVEATAATGIPLLMLRRPGFVEAAGDRWHRVPSLEAAAGLIGELGSRVLLTSGRQGIAAFAGLHQCWFLARSVEPPEPPMPASLEVVLDRGPFTFADELELMRRHRIDVLVTKDSGGDAPKLAAARSLTIPVIMVDRPPLPPSTSAAESVAEAITWLGS